MFTNYFSNLSKHYFKPRRLLASVIKFPRTPKTLGLNIPHFTGPLNCIKTQTSSSFSPMSLGLRLSHKKILGRKVKRTNNNNVNLKSFIRNIGSQSTESCENNVNLKSFIRNIGSQSTESCENNVNSFLKKNVLKMKLKNFLFKEKHILQQNKNGLTTNLTNQEKTKFRSSKFQIEPKNLNCIQASNKQFSNPKVVNANFAWPYKTFSIAHLDVESAIYKKIIPYASMNEVPYLLSTKDLPFGQGQTRDKYLSSTYVGLRSMRKSKGIAYPTGVAHTQKGPRMPSVMDNKRITFYSPVQLINNSVNTKLLTASQVEKTQNIGFLFYWLIPFVGFIFSSPRPHSFTNTYTSFPSPFGPPGISKYFVGTSYADVISSRNIEQKLNSPVEQLAIGSYNRDILFFDGLKGKAEEVHSFIEPVGTAYKEVPYRHNVKALTSWSSALSPVHRSLHDQVTQPQHSSTTPWVKEILPSTSVIARHSANVMPTLYLKFETHREEIQSVFHKRQVFRKEKQQLMQFLPYAPQVLRLQSQTTKDYEFLPFPSQKVGTVEPRERHPMQFLGMLAGEPKGLKLLNFCCYTRRVSNPNLELNTLRPCYIQPLFSKPLEVFEKTLFKQNAKPITNKLTQVGMHRVESCTTWTMFNYKKMSMLFLNSIKKKANKNFVTKDLINVGFKQNHSVLGNFFTKLKPYVQLLRDPLEDSEVRGENTLRPYEKTEGRRVLWSNVNLKLDHPILYTLENVNKSRKNFTVSQENVTRSVILGGPLQSTRKEVYSVANPGGYSVDPSNVHSSVLRKPWVLINDFYGHFYGTRLNQKSVQFEHVLRNTRTDSHPRLSSTGITPLNASSNQIQESTPYSRLNSLVEKKHLSTKLNNLSFSFSKYINFLLTTNFTISPVPTFSFKQPEKEGFEGKERKRTSMYKNFNFFEKMFRAGLSKGLTSQQPNSLNLVDKAFFHKFKKISSKIFLQRSKNLEYSFSCLNTSEDLNRKQYLVLNPRTLLNIQKFYKGFFSKYSSLNNLLTERFILKQKKQKKRRVRKYRKQTLSRKKRKRFYPRPLWLRYRMLLNFSTSTHFLSELRNPTPALFSPKKQLFPNLATFNFTISNVTKKYLITHYLPSKGLHLNVETTGKKNQAIAGESKVDTIKTGQTLSATRQPHPHDFASIDANQTVFNENRAFLFIKKSHLNTYFKRLKHYLKGIRTSTQRLSSNDMFTLKVSNNSVQPGWEHLLKPHPTGKQSLYGLARALQGINLDYVNENEKKYLNEKEEYNRIMYARLQKIMQMSLTNGQKPSALSQPNLLSNLVGKSQAQEFISNDSTNQVFSKKAYKPGRTKIYLGSPEGKGSEYSKPSSKDPQDTSPLKRTKDFKQKTFLQETWMWLYNIGYGNLCWGSSFGLNTLELPSQIKPLYLSWALNKTNNWFFAKLATKAKIEYKNTPQNKNLWVFQRLRHQGKSNKTKYLQRTINNFLQAFTNGQQKSKFLHKITRNTVYQKRHHFPALPFGESASMPLFLGKSWDPLPKKMGYLHPPSQELHMNVLSQDFVIQCMQNLVSIKKKFYVNSSLQFIHSTGKAFEIPTKSPKGKGETINKPHKKILQNWKRKEQKLRYLGLNTLQTSIRTATLGTYLETKQQKMFVKTFQAANSQNNWFLCYRNQKSRALPFELFASSHLKDLFFFNEANSETKRLSNSDATAIKIVSNSTVWANVNQYIKPTFSSVFFHFCALMSLISIFQIRCFFKFNFLIFFKLMSNCKMLIQSILLTFAKFMKTNTLNNTIVNKRSRKASQEKQFVHDLTFKNNPQQISRKNIKVAFKDHKLNVRRLHFNLGQKRTNYFASFPMNYPKGSGNIPLRNATPKLYEIPGRMQALQSLRRRRGAPYYEINEVPEGKNTPKNNNSNEQPIAVSGSVKTDLLQLKTLYFTVFEQIAFNSLQLLKTKSSDPTPFGNFVGTSYTLNASFLSPLRLASLITLTTKKMKEFLKMIMAFSKNPEIFINDFVANAFLVEWSSDLIILIPENLEFMAWNSFRLCSQTIKSGFLFSSFSFALSNIFVAKQNLNNVQEVYKVSTKYYELPMKYPAGGSPQSEGFDFYFTLFMTNFVHKIIYSMGYSFVQILAQPDTDLIVRKQKGIIFWEKWAEILTKAADKYNIVIPSLAILKDEQNLFISLITKETSSTANKSNLTTHTKHLLFFPLALQRSKRSRIVYPEGVAPVFRTDATLQVMLSKQSKNVIRIKDTKHYLEQQRIQQDRGSTEHLKGMKTYNIPRNYLSTLPVVHSATVSEPSKANRKQDLVVLFSSVDSIQKRYEETPLNYFENLGYGSFGFLETKDYVVSQQTSKLDPMELAETKWLNGFVQTTLMKNNRLVGNNISVNQFVTTLSKDTDLFLDSHLAKSFAHLSSIRYYNQVQNALGFLTCSIFSGVFSKQQAKNILILGTSLDGMDHSRFEKSLLISALAGETELKIITDNANRYALIVGGVAVGIRLLRDVFDALALHAPCLFLLENIHAIGERRPFLYADSSQDLTKQSEEILVSGSPEMQLQMEEQNKIQAESSYHAIKHYKKPYKGEFSLVIPTNHFSFDLFKTKSQSLKTPSLTKKIPIKSKTTGTSEPHTRDMNSMEEKFINNFLLLKNLFFGVMVNTNTFGVQEQSKKNRASTSYTLRDYGSISRRDCKQQVEKGHRKASFLFNENVSLISRIQSNVQQINSKFIAPPATSPLNVLVIKEQKKFKPEKIVQELGFHGLSNEKLVHLPRYSYSVRSKVALLAENALSNMSAKLDMITDLLMIFDSVRTHRGFVVFATTHVPSILDPALRRPGRLDETIRIPKIENIWSRWQIFKTTMSPFFSHNSIGSIPFPFDSNSSKASLCTLNLIDYRFLGPNLLKSEFFINQISSLILTPQETKQQASHLVYTNLLENQKVVASTYPTGVATKTPKISTKIKAMTYYTIGQNLMHTKLCYNLGLYGKSLDMIRENGLEQYITFYSNKTLFRILFIHMFTGKLSERFAFSCFSSRQASTSSSKNKKINSIGRQKGTLATTLYNLPGGHRLSHGLGGNEALHTNVSILFSLFQKRYMFNKNLILPSLLDLGVTSINNRFQPESPPNSLILIPAKRYENYKRARLVYEKKLQISITEKIQLHQQKKYILNLYNLDSYSVSDAPRKESTESKVVKTTRTMSPKGLSSYLSLNNVKKDCHEITATHKYFRQHLLKRHRQYLTNQWWSLQLPEQNAETLFLSDLDWRYTFIPLLGDFLIDYPDAEQFYNPYQHQSNNTMIGQQVTNSLKSKSKSLLRDSNNFNKTFRKEIFEHYINESVMKIMNWLDKNRELLDYSAYVYQKKGFIKENHLITNFKRFSKPSFLVKN